VVNPEKPMTAKKDENNLRVLGILNIITGAIFAMGGVVLALSSSLTNEIAGWQITSTLGSISASRAALGIASVIGGICAVKGRCWGLALTGAILNIFLLIWTIRILFSWGTPMLFYTGWVPMVVDLIMMIVLFVMSIGAILLAIKGKAQFLREKSWKSPIIGTICFSIGVGLLLIGYVRIIITPAITMYYGRSKGIYSILSVLMIICSAAAIFGGFYFFKKVKLKTE
jgi:hypothetical protein